MELNKITKGMSNAADAIDQNFTAVEQNIDLLQLDTVKKLYDSGTTLAINTVKNNWNTFIVNSADNPTDMYQIRVSGNRLGIAVVGKIDNSNGRVLLIDTNGTSVHTLTNGSWS